MKKINNLDVEKFLKEYWQKKPLVIRNAFPQFKNPVSPDELAGLALEESIESRMVIHTPHQAPYWVLKQGPFQEEIFSQLPDSHWTLLVNGVDRIVPEVYELSTHFNFIPQWRFDDVMISYAAEHGSVGPHYDNYDVFLFQAVGTRKWMLTTKNCTPENYLENVPLRIMEEFITEEEYILEEGDILYLPPHVGHYGISQSKDCMTYSFGYRSYQGLEMWQDFGDFLVEQSSEVNLYRDPVWKQNKPGLIPADAWLNAKALLQKCLDDDALLKRWFGQFTTLLSAQEELELNERCSSSASLKRFKNTLFKSKKIQRSGFGRMAYIESEFHCFINGTEFDTASVDKNLVKQISNDEVIHIQDIGTLLENEANIEFLSQLYYLGVIDLKKK